MALLHFLFLLLLVVAATSSEFPQVVGTFQGMADWYEFMVDESEDFGGSIINYQQNTKLIWTEQQGPFFRGSEYYEDPSYPTGWKFVCNLYGIMTEKTNQKGTYSVRISEYLNEDIGKLEKSTETIGIFTGTLINSTNSVPEFSLEYTGETMKRNKFGAQHFVATLVQ